MKHLFVWMHRPDGTLGLVGELATTDPIAGGRFNSEFEYAPGWTTDPTAPALDPVSLPRHPPGRRYRSEQFFPPLAVFEDALPDDWGRALLTRALKQEHRQPSLIEMLLRVREAGTGALLFTEAPTAPALSSTPQSTALPTLVSAAEEFERGTLQETSVFRKLLEGSSRVGGARPKALVHDTEGEWIAKFPSVTRDGTHDVVGLEATCLELARNAGLITTQSRLQSVGNRRVLLVRRFDITPQGGRLHMVSMRTLCKERPGIYVNSYSDLARVLDKHSAAAPADVAMLFRHMVFNAAIGNVDDHLKNFWVLATSKGYRLAPAFDLVPDITGRGEHTLSFQYQFACPQAEQLMEIAAGWEVPNAAEIIGQVTAAVAQFSATASQLAVGGGNSLGTIQADIHRRIQLINPKLRFDPEH